MTRLLEKAFAEASELPEDEQNAFAEFVLEELRADKKWSQAFGSSQDALAPLGRDVLAQHRQGNTKRLDSEEL